MTDEPAESAEHAESAESPEHAESPEPAGARRVVRRTPVRRRRRRDKDAFRIGPVLGRGLSIWLTNAPAILLLSLVVFAPLFAYYAWANYWAPEHVGSRLYVVIDNQGQNVLGFVLSATLIYATVQRLLGRPAHLGRSFAHGLSRFFPVLGTSIVMGLILLVAGMVSGLVLGVPAALAAGAVDASGGVLSQTVLAIVVVIPVLYVYCGLFVAVPVCVVERPGVFRAIARSRHLTQGFRGKIYLLALMYLVTGFVLGAIAGAFGQGLGAGAFDLMLVGVQALMMSIAGVVTAVAYNDLRTAVEGADTRQIAAIFE